MEEMRRPPIMSSRRAGQKALTEGVALTVRVLHLVAAGKPVLSNLPFGRRQVLRKLRDMDRRGYLAKKGDTCVLTPRGRRLLSEEKIWELNLPKQKRWDLRWRMVLYDIPLHKNKQRQIFRAKLKELGLLLYQDSVWVYPYPLEEVVGVIADFYGIRKYVLFAIAEQLNGEDRLRKQFGL